MILKKGLKGELDLMGLRTSSGRRTYEHSGLCVKHLPGALGREGRND